MNDTQAVIRAANNLAASLERQLIEAKAENARLRAALATLWEWNESIQDGKGNHHPEDHLSIIRAALNHEQG